MLTRTGNIWSQYDNPNTIILVTTNASLDSRGDLIMGGGIALEARERFPWLPRQAAIDIKRFGERDYNLILYPDKKIGLLQTKRQVQYNSPKSLVQQSITNLRFFAIAMPTWEFHTGRPGCGLGGLDWEKDMRQYCESELPDNVTVWSYK